MIPRLLKLALLVELIYLLLVNAALNLPLTQTAVNLVRPDKFHLTWERGWSWYPFRVHATGISADGQSRSQQWQLDSPRASASIAILPLLFKRVWIRDVLAEDVRYRQRPRLKPDRDYSHLLPLFPPIRNRPVGPADSSPRKQRRPWHIEVGDIRVSGEHHTWIFQARLRATGSARGDLTYRSRGGPFSLDVTAADLDLGPLQIGDTGEGWTRGRVRGSLGFAPFVPREHRDLSLLEFLFLELDLNLDMRRLDFINLFTQDFRGLTVDGTGEVDGRLHYDRGKLLPGTQLVVEADDLRLSLLDYLVAGEGTVNLAMDERAGDALSLALEYRGLEVMHSADAEPFLQGRDLSLTIGGNGYLLPVPGRLNPSRRIGFEVQGLDVPDLSLLQRHVPEQWPFRFWGGGGHLEGGARLSTTSLDLDLRLSSEEADLGFGDYRFTTDMRAGLNLHNPDLLHSGTRLAGSFLRLGDARLARGERGNRAPWQASLEILEGEFDLFPAPADAADDDLIDLLRLLAESRGKRVFADSSGEMDFTARVSDLAWLGVFLPPRYATTVAGSGAVTGRLNLAGGMPEVGTDILVSSDDLRVEVLDYANTGSGEVRLQVERGGEQPDWRVDLSLREGEMRRRGESESMIGDVRLGVEAAIENMSLNSDDRDIDLRFTIDSAQVLDMSAFNGYLPVDGPVAFTGGTARLAADLRLQPDDASGWLTLDSTGLEARVDEQSVSADLRADIALRGGTPQQMRFDIAGSELYLDNVRVLGEREGFAEDQWSARMTLLRGQTRWRAPLQLEVEAGLTMSDSRPFIALFDNQGWRPKFLSRMLTVEDIQGRATLEMADGTLLVPRAHATSDNIELGARGLIGQGERTGVIYLAYKNADALLRLNNGRRNLDVIRAREKYQAYHPARP